jgi:Flp pilus assembly pilin Flp
MKQLIKRLWVEEEAATATEYGIIAAFLAVGIVVALMFLRERLKSLFTNAGNAISAGQGN